MNKNTMNENTMNKNTMNKGKIGAIIAGAVVVSVGVGLMICTEKVPAGYVGVVYSMNGGIEKEVLNQGWHLVGPTKKVTTYSIATEQLYLSADKKEGSRENESFDVVCRDGKMNVDFEMSYAFDADKINELFTRYRGMSGEDVIDNIVRGKVKTFTNEVTSQYSVLEAHMEKKGEINKKLTERLKEGLAEYGINVESATLTQTRVDETIEAAITERSKASQELEAEKQRREKAELEAETKKIQAQGEADAALIKAQGEAEANRVLQESLTSELIELKRIEKWNGSNAQTVVNGTDATVVTGE